MNSLPPVGEYPLPDVHGLRQTGHVCMIALWWACYSPTRKWPLLIRPIGKLKWNSTISWVDNLNTLCLWSSLCHMLNSIRSVIGLETTSMNGILLIFRDMVPLAPPWLAYLNIWWLSLDPLYQLYTTCPSLHPCGEPIYIPTEHHLDLVLSEARWQRWYDCGTVHATPVNVNQYRRG